MAQPGILNTVKLAIGLAPDDDSFDDQLLMYINSTFATIHQLGAGPDKDFLVEDANTKWDDYMEPSYARNFVKDLVCKEVQKKFDPPTSSAMSQALDEEIAELTYRLNREVELGSDSEIN